MKTSITLLAISAVFIAACSSSKKNAISSACSTPVSTITTAAVSNSPVFIFSNLFSIPDSKNKKSEQGLNADLYKNLRYYIHGRYSHKVKKETLNEAKSLSDFIPDYPTNWIDSYTSVEIEATCNGNKIKALSKDNSLSPEQKNILETVDLATNITVNINYKCKNTFTNTMENKRIDYSMMIIPEIEAEYIGGYKEMINYLKESSIDKISEINPKRFQVIVMFTVNGEGEICDAIVSATSGERAIDTVLLDAINKMPKWKPAENLKGIKVKQEFEFSVNLGNYGC